MARITIDVDLSNYPKTGCNPRKIQDLRAFSDIILSVFDP